MKNPKEKAKQLVAKYIYYVESFSSDQQEENAKQCALITVDEIINGNFADGYDHNYWQEVKKEIELL